MARRVRPTLNDEARDEPIACYCITHYRDRVSVPTLMARKAVEAHRDNFSDAWKQGGCGAEVWGQHVDEMAKKTVLRRAAKTWPITAPGDGRDIGEVLDHAPTMPAMRDVTPPAAAAPASRQNVLAADD